MASYVWMIGTKPQRGTGMLVLFADLDEQWHQGFRTWLQGDMFPARLNIGFRTCASYDLVDEFGVEGGGLSSFLTVYETDNLGVLYSKPYQKLRSNRDPRDAAFHKRFKNLDRYTLSWVGPEITNSKQRFAPYVFVDRFNLHPKHIHKFNSWLVDDYFESCDRISGLLRLRRFVAIEGSFSSFLFHEFEDLSVLNDRNWRKLRADPACLTLLSKIESPKVYRLEICAP